MDLGRPESSLGSGMSNSLKVLEQGSHRMKPTPFKTVTVILRLYGTTCNTQTTPHILFHLNLTTSSEG